MKKVDERIRRDGVYRTYCETVIHELGHNLGLVDLYDGTYDDGYFCRNKGPSDAIMSGGGLNTRRDSYPDIWYCVCDNSKCNEQKLKPKNLDEIQKMNFPDFKINQSGICLKGSSLSLNAYKNFSGSEMAASWFKKYIPNAYFVLNREANLNMSTFGKFYPAEIRSITFPGCLEKNKQYYDCAVEAYKKTDCKNVNACNSFDYQ